MRLDSKLKPASRIVVVHIRSRLAHTQSQAPNYFSGPELGSERMTMDSDEHATELWPDCALQVTHIALDSKLRTTELWPEGACKRLGSVGQTCIGADYKPNHGVFFGFPPETQET